MGGLRKELQESDELTSLDCCSAPFDEILRTGRCEGELEHRKTDESRVAVSSTWSLHRNEQQLPSGLLKILWSGS